MRLDKLTIGSAKDSPTHQFKNLKNVTIDFDQDHWVTVVIGWNGTGKSNVLEALAIIFRDFIALKRRPSFAFKLRYRMGSGNTLRHIFIDSDPDRKIDPIQVFSGSSQEIDEAMKVTKIQNQKLGYFLENQIQKKPQHLAKCRINILNFFKRRWSIFAKLCFLLLFGGKRAYARDF